MIRAGLLAARLCRAMRVGREPVACVCLVIATLLVVTAPASALESPPELRRVVSAGDPEWTVVWQATTAEEHGQFRLYGGPALGSLQLVDIQPAARGLAGYRFRDEHSGVPGWYYQLRYVSSEGEELVLGSLRIDPVGLQPTPASIFVPAPVAKAMPCTAPLLWLTSQRQSLPADEAVANSARPEPDVPPPRAAA